MIKKLFFILLLGLIIPYTSFAAFDFLNVKLNPVTPGENEDVTISINTYDVDLDASEIIWSVNKDPIKQGIGEKTLKVQTGDFGSTLEVKVVVLSNLGKRIEKTINISPSEIDFLWEAKTYTPPFYKGKALPTFKSLVKVTAIPRVNRAGSNPKEFTYNWKYNRTLGVGQGLGKDSTIVPMDFAGTPVNVGVEVALPNTEWKGTKSTNITAGEAVVRFYEQAPLLGINFNKALNKNYDGTGNQFTIKAVPYYFSLDDKDEDMLIYTWRVNKANVIPDLDPTVLTITKNEGVTDAVKFDVQLKIQTTRHLLQRGQVGTLITLPQEER